MVKGRKNNDCLEDVYIKDEVDDLLDYKAEKSVVTSSINGLMSSADKTKLDKFQVLSGQVNVWDLDAGIYYLFSGGTINYSDSDSLILSSPITMIVKYASDEWDYTIYAGDKIYKGKTVEASITIGGVTTYVHTGDEIDELVSGTILYDSTTPITATTTLNNINFDNYKKLDVVIGRSDGAIFSGVVQIDLEKTRDTGSIHINSFNFVDNDGTITFLYHLRAKFSGSTITISGNNSVLRISDSGGISSISTPLVGIFKIVGYK